MMIKFVFILFFATIASGLFGQMTLDNLKAETSKTIKKDKDTTIWNWKRGGLVNLSVSQGSLSNWAAGGDNFSLSVSSYFNYYLFFIKDRISWDNNFDFNLGYIQTSSGGGQKNDDRVNLLSKYGYKMDSTGKWYISGLFDFRTQFFDGYNNVGGVQTFSSTFMAPAYITLSAGFDYKPSSKFSAFLSPLTSRWIIVTKHSLNSEGKYGVDTGKSAKYELGAYASFNYQNTFNKTLNYKGRLDLFSDYLDHPQNVALYMTNQFAAKLSRYFSFTYSLDLIYDDRIRQFGPNGTSPALQVKSLVGVGFLKPLNVVRVKKITNPI